MGSPRRPPQRPRRPAVTSRPMYCASCNYPLWGIQRRRCPECGASFRPSSYSFPKSSVRFCCTHCDQDYYGTSPHGHLRPSAFTCVRCGSPQRMDEMTVRQRPGLEKVLVNQIAQLSNPWTTRRDLGRLSAWSKTLLLGQATPVRLLMVTPPSAGGGVKFLCCLLALIASVQALSCFAAMGVEDALFTMVLWDAALLLFALLGPLLAALLTHGVLRAIGRAPHGLGRTVDSVMYTSGPLEHACVPVLGMLWLPLGLLWWSALASAGMCGAQRVSLRTARLITGFMLLPPALALLALMYTVFNLTIQHR